MNNDDLLATILNETTVIRIDDNQTHATVFEDPIDQEYHPFNLQYREPHDFSTLETNWQNKWNSFGNQWNQQRQLFRFLWFEVRAFLESYRLYRENFASALSLSFEDDGESRTRRNQDDLRAELGIRSMYEYGKQAIDLLRLISQQDQTIRAIVVRPEVDIFLNQFRESRNKFLIHYHNPHRFRDLVFDPSFISVMGTGGLFEINVHIQNQVERRYSLYINHNADYYRLEEIMAETIGQF